MTSVRAKATRAPRRRGNRRRPASLKRRLPGPAALLGVGARLTHRMAPALGAIAFAGTAFGATLFGLHWLTTSPRFALRQVVIAGNLERTDAELIAHLGLRRGDNLFQLELGALEATLELDPWIADARIMRRLPNLLRIEVKERSPVAVVALNGLYLVDTGGRVFKRASTQRGEPAGLPVITGIQRREYLEDPNATQARIRHGLEVARAWSDGGERAALGEIRLEPRGGITLYTYEDGVAVHLRRTEPGALAGRLRAFDAAWAALSPSEKRAARSIHIGRADGASAEEWNRNIPRRITVALAAGDKHSWAK